MCYGSTSQQDSFFETTVVHQDVESQQKLRNADKKKKANLEEIKEMVTAVEDEVNRDISFDDESQSDPPEILGASQISSSNNTSSSETEEQKRRTSLFSKSSQLSKNDYIP